MEHVRLKLYFRIIIIITILVEYLQYPDSERQKKMIPAKYVQYNESTFKK